LAGQYDFKGDSLTSKMSENLKNNKDLEKLKCDVLLINKNANIAAQ